MITGAHIQGCSCLLLLVCKYLCRTDCTHTHAHTDTQTYTVCRLVEIRLHHGRSGCVSCTCIGGNDPASQAGIDAIHTCQSIERLRDLEPFYKASKGPVAGRGTNLHHTGAQCTHNMPPGHDILQNCRSTLQHNPYRLVFAGVSPALIHVLSG